MKNIRKKMSGDYLDAQTETKPQLSVSPKGFLRLPQVLELFPVSKTTWWAGVKAGRYPAGIKLSPRVTAWRVEDVAALITNSVS